MLDLDDCALTEKNLSLLLSFLEEAHNLKVLILSNNNLTDRAIEQLCNRLLKFQIQTIDLSGNLVTSQALQHLLELAQ